MYIYIYIYIYIYTDICSSPGYGGIGYDKSMHMWTCIYTRLYSHMHLRVHMHMHRYIWANMNIITPSPVSFGFLVTHQYCIHQLKLNTNPIFSIYGIRIQGQHSKPFCLHRNRNNRFISHNLLSSRNHQRIR